VNVGWVERKRNPSNNYHNDKYNQTHKISQANQKLLTMMVILAISIALKKKEKRGQT